MGTSLLRSLGALAVPPRCGACELPCPAAEPLCARCAEALGSAAPLVDPGPPGVDLAVAAGEYSAELRALAHALKFRRRLSLAVAGAAAIERAAAPLGVLRGVLVPVPPAPLRRLARGFDPAEELALALAASAGLELSRCLRRSSGPRQVGRSRSERLASPPEVSLRRRRRAPHTVVLVDDVRTTGATLGACAAALRAAGSTRVSAVTLARSAGLTVGVGSETRQMGSTQGGPREDRDSRQELRGHR